jgi:hypothetical protein
MNKKSTRLNEDSFGGKQTTETADKVGQPTPSESDSPKPPEIPTVDRTTGKVSCPEEQLDGWINREDPDETFNMGPDYCRPSNRKPHSGYGFVV